MAKIVLLILLGLIVGVGFIMSTDKPSDAQNRRLAHLEEQTALAAAIAEEAQSKLAEGLPVGGPYPYAMYYIDHANRSVILLSTFSNASFTLNDRFDACERYSESLSKKQSEDIIDDEIQVGCGFNYKTFLDQGYQLVE